MKTAERTNAVATRDTCFISKCMCCNLLGRFLLVDRSCWGRIGARPERSRETRPRRAQLGTLEKIVHAQTFDAETVLRVCPAMVTRSINKAEQRLSNHKIYKFPTTSCSSAAIHCGALSGGNRTGAPIFTFIFPGRANFFFAFFTSKSPSIRMGTIGIARLLASSPTPARNGASCRQWCGALREKPECCSRGPRILRQKQSSRGNPPHAARETD